MVERPDGLNVQTPYRKKLLAQRRGDELLRDVAAFDLKMENGEVVQVRIADELAVPDDPRALAYEAKRAPARLAFWAYQTERALSNLRAREREAERAEGGDYLMYRTYIQEHTQAEIATEGNIRARVAAMPSEESKAAKELLADAQLRYGVLRALRDASEHRSHLLRRLIAHESEGG